MIRDSATMLRRNLKHAQRYPALTVMLATPTFLRAYLRKAEPPQLRSLRLLITGAEKLPDELAKAFAERFGKEVLQGYGLTETSPVASVNLPEPKATKPGQPEQYPIYLTRPMPI